ncbi:DNA/RNA nuclease SfsA [bacterium]|nr:DNA/RNA nuclease SfsA [bacterium]
MRYGNTEEGVFLRRPNRFEAYVKIGGAETLTHVKNTGRCRELLVPGARVVLNRSEDPGRKTAYDLVAVYKKGLGLVNIDSQSPNRAVGEWLKSGSSRFGKLDFLKPEYAYGSSRIDFYFEKGSERMLLEVKGCTLEKKGVGYFPDAPTERGARHVRELAASLKEGFRPYLAFVIAMPKVREVLPNEETDPAFARAYEKALEAGVKVLFLRCHIRKDCLEIKSWEEKE